MIWTPGLLNLPIKQCRSCHHQGQMLADSRLIFCPSKKLTYVTLTMFGVASVQLSTQITSNQLPSRRSNGEPIKARVLMQDTGAGSIVVVNANIIQCSGGQMVSWTFRRFFMYSLEGRFRDFKYGGKAAAAVREPGYRNGIYFIHLSTCCCLS